MPQVAGGRPRRHPAALTRLGAVGRHLGAARGGQQLRPRGAAARREEHELVIEGAELIDGTGRPRYTAQVRMYAVY
jgi:hypothetical protein